MEYNIELSLRNLSLLNGGLSIRIYKTLIIKTEENIKNTYSLRNLIINSKYNAIKDAQIQFMIMHNRAGLLRASLWNTLFTYWNGMGPKLAEKAIRKIIMHPILSCLNKAKSYSNYRYQLIRLQLIGVLNKNSNLKLMLL